MACISEGSCLLSGLTLIDSQTQEETLSCKTGKQMVRVYHTSEAKYRVYFRETCPGSHANKRLLKQDYKLFFKQHDVWTLSENFPGGYSEFKLFCRQIRLL